MLLLLLNIQKLQKKPLVLHNNFSMNNKWVMALFFLFALPIFVGAQKPPSQWALSGQLERKTFRLDIKDAVLVDVFDEKDFEKNVSGKNITFVLKSDIELTKPIVFSKKRKYLLRGNGHRISPKYPNPWNFSKPMKSQSWSFDTITGLINVILPDKPQWTNITDASNVYVYYEAWFQRFSDKVISTKGNVVTFRCTHEKMKNPKYLRLTPTPVIFFAKKAPYPKGISALDALIQVDAGSTVEILNVGLVGADASCCINNKGTIRITNSKVRNCDNDGVVSSGNLFVNHCLFTEITKYAVSSIQNSYTDVQNCTFRHIGMRGSNSASVHSRGDAYIANNDFFDVNYCAISLGYINLTKESYLPSSIAENNCIAWTKNWSKKMKWYGLVDGGAIYVATNNKRCIVRNNVITNFGGHGSNRGIYCDDGAYNVTVYGNTISGTQNSYDIDSRDCSKKPPRSMPEGYHSNTNIFIGYNICSGYVRMCGASAVANNNCYFENNVIVGNPDTSKNVVQNNKAQTRPIVYDKKARITRRGHARLKSSKKLINHNS